jgi:hypothetical protein
MTNHSNITLIEAQSIVMQLPTSDRWALVKTLIESLQPENSEHSSIDFSAPSTPEMMALAQSSGSFDFLHTEPDLYTLADGEPV